MFEELEDYRFGLRNAQRSAQARPMFSVLYTPDRGRSWFPAYGLELTSGGFKVVGRTTIPEGEIPMKLSLGNKVIDIKARQAWHSIGSSKGAPLQEYGMEILTLGTTGRDAITRWLETESVQTAEDGQEGDTIAIDPAEVDRLIPLAFQHSLKEALVRAGRLAPAASGKYPALGYEYGGVSDYKGASMHHFIVYSRVIRRNDVYNYATRVLVNENGTSVVFEPILEAA